MTLKELEDKIFDIINTGDDPLVAQDKADLIMEEILEWQYGR